jgi:hypothetical protein
MASSLYDLLNGASFSNSGDIDADNRANGILELAKKYDPNASVGESGNIVYDKSKLPQMSDQLKSIYGTGNGFFNNFSNVQNDGTGKYTGNGGADVNDKSKIIHDDNYGDYVYKGYMGQAPGDSTSGFMGQMGKYMPSVVSAIMAAGMGVGAGPLMGGLLSSGLGPGGIGNKLAMGEKVDWGNVAKNAGMSVAGGLIGGGIPGLQGMGTMPKQLGDIMKYINMARQGYGAYSTLNRLRG